MCVCDDIRHDKVAGCALPMSAWTAAEWGLASVLNAQRDVKMSSMRFDIFEPCVAAAAAVLVAAESMPAGHQLCVAAETQEH